MGLIVDTVIASSRRNPQIDAPWLCLHRPISAIGALLLQYLEHKFLLPIRVAGPPICRLARKSRTVRIRMP